MPSYHDLIKTDIIAILSPAIDTLVDLVTEQVAETHTNDLRTYEKYKKALTDISSLTVEDPDHYEINIVALAEAINIAKTALQNI